MAPFNPPTGVDNQPGGKREKSSWKRSAAWPDNAKRQRIAPAWNVLRAWQRMERKEVNEGPFQKRREKLLQRRGDAESFALRTSVSDWMARRFEKSIRDRSQ